MVNWNETLPSDCEVQSVVRFRTIENNSRVEIHHRLHAAYRGENVMNLRNVLLWKSIFQGEHTYTTMSAKGD